MKLSTKPISSPGRADKFPPPLMRFLRSNVGSRSRGLGRSRSSPMFVRKKNASVETQEPSSPKVTCMGQVRVRHSSSKQAIGAPTIVQCRWLRAALFCSNNFSGKNVRERFRKVRQKWVLFFQMGFRGEPEIHREDSAQVEPKFGHEISGSELDDDEVVVVGKVIGSSNSTPPKNAFLLTRCRSAPYRSSSLASRFWSSPLRSEDDEQKTEQENRDSVSDRENRVEGQNAEEENQVLRKSEDTEAIKLEGVDGLGKSASLPLILTRCKSEPVRIAENKLAEDKSSVIN